MIALLLIAGGVVAYRWDTNLSGLLVLVSYLPGAPTVAYTSYRPSLVEWMAGMGIISYGLMLFSLGVRYLRVVDHRPVHEAREPITIETAETVTA